MNSDDICDVAPQIETRGDFVKFLKNLEMNNVHCGSDWENDTLDRYIEAMGRWTHDCDGYFKNTDQDVNPDLPTWKLFAEILLAAKVYE